MDHTMVLIGNIGDLNVALHGQRLCRVLSSYPHLTHVVHLPRKEIFQTFKNISMTTFLDTKKCLEIRRKLFIQFFVGQKFVLNWNSFAC